MLVQGVFSCPLIVKVTSYDRVTKLIFSVKENMKLARTNTLGLSIFFSRGGHLKQNKKREKRKDERK